MLHRPFSIVCTLGAAIALQASLAAAQDLTVEDVVRRSIEARGGQQAWDAIEGLEMRGSFSTFSKKAPCVLYRQRPDRYRFDFQYADRDATVAWDGERSWWAGDAVFTQVSWPVEAPLAHAAALENDAEFGGPLLDYRAKGHRIELAGKADLDGEETYQLDVTLANGSVETWHLSPESFLPLARLSTGADARMPVPRRTFFSDYRDAAGFLFPHRVEIELGFRYQVMVVDEIEVNPTLAAGWFKLPLAGDMGQLASLIGNWDVEVKSRPYPNMPWLESRTTSSIRSLAGGNLLEHEISYLDFGRRRHVQRQCSYDRFRDVFRIVLFDSLTSHSNVLEGRLEDGRLTATNLETGTTWGAKGKTYHTRELIYDLEPDRFKVDLELSTDGGETWFATVKLDYTRRVPDSPP